MKKLILSIILMTAVSLVGYSQITGTGHDFSAETWNASGEICIVCHTPHNSQTLTDAPLWNHTTSTANYTLYSNLISGTFNATSGQPDGASKLCLSCHDGTVKVDDFINGGPTSPNYTIPGIFNLGIDLSNDHPLSFVYDAGLATTDGGLFNPTNHNTALGGTIQNDLLISDKMQCSSCHDVHNKYNNSSLLKIDNAGSALCLTCHDK